MPLLVKRCQHAEREKSEIEKYSAATFSATELREARAKTKSIGRLLKPEADVCKTQEGS